MGRQRLTEEEKEQNFNNWKATPEYKAIEEFMAERDKIPNKVLEVACVDLCYPI